jgi:hypothetical protein
MLFKKQDTGIAFGRLEGNHDLVQLPQEVNETFTHQRMVFDD